ncbi:MAG: CDP-alcohol phosphatidyltransferase family protein [Gammaproteobacteria bacterium]
MASIYDLKPAFQNLLRPLTERLARAGITANQVTVAAAILSFVAGAIIFAFPDKRWPLLLIPLVLFLRMALNAIDGMLAREHEMKTPLGAILNELGDVFSDCALYLPLAVVPGIDARLIVVVVILAVISEMTGVLGVQTGADRRYDGPMGKSDRAFVFGTLGVLLGLGLAAGMWVHIVLGIVVVLLALTIFNRARSALHGRVC